MTIQPLDIKQISEKTDNIYETVFIVSKRAKQIISNLKKEEAAQLIEFNVKEEEANKEKVNPQRLAISKYYENLKKPVEKALEEYLADELFVSNDLH